MTPFGRLAGNIDHARAVIRRGLDDGWIHAYERLDLLLQQVVALEVRGHPPTEHVPAVEGRQIDAAEVGLTEVVGRVENFAGRHRVVAAEQIARSATLHERTQRRLTRQTAEIQDGLGPNGADGVLDLDVVVIHRHAQVFDRRDHEAQSVGIGLLGPQVEVASGKLVVLPSRIGRDLAVTGRSHTSVRALCRGKPRRCSGARIGAGEQRDLGAGEQGIGARCADGAIVAAARPD